MRIIFLGIFLLFSFTIKAQGLDIEYQKVLNALSIISEFYVEDVDKKEISENAIRNILKELDPHSVYISKEEVQEMNEPLVGNFEGVGIQFNILEDTIFVVATIAGGPSEKVGVLAGDKIVSIDDEVVAGIEITNKMVMERLRGNKNTEVTIGVKRNGSKRILDFKIIRDKIPLYSVDAVYMATPEIGYIKVNRFAAQTAQEFKEAILKLKEQGMQSLIVDLQGNSGGYLNAAFQMTDEFLDIGKMIVYTEGENSPRNEMKATAYGNFLEGNLVVLVDQYSASASEILSGAIQDWDRGLVIGRRTYGKGLVQRPFALPDGSQIRLTIANYYTPSGRFIQRPYDDGVEEYRKDIMNRFDSGELTDSMKAEFPDSLKFTTNAGRIVYGGGGISPDYIIPIDTTIFTEYYSMVRREGLINRYVLNYVDKNRESLMEFYTDLNNFDENFESQGDFVQEFYKFAEEEGVERIEEDIEKSTLLIGTQLKALIARNIFDSDAFYYVFNKEFDAIYKKAIEIIEQNHFEKFNIK
jgi:carboxyl-terminal processing protease